METLQATLEPTGIPDDTGDTVSDCEASTGEASIIALPDFISNFGAGLLDAVRRQNPSIYDGQRPAHWDVLLDGLSRQPFPAQREVIHAITTLLTRHAPGGVINAEMGTGKVRRIGA